MTHSKHSSCTKLNLNQQPNQTKEEAFVERMLDITLSQLTVLGVTIYFLFGPQEVKKGARLLGKSLGRAVSKVNAARLEVMETIQKEQMNAPQSDLRKGFESFINVQSEIRSATLNPLVSVQQMVMRGGSVDGQMYVPRAVPSMTTAQMVANPVTSATLPIGSSTNGGETSSFGTGATINSTPFVGTTEALSVASGSREYSPTADRAQLYANNAARLAGTLRLPEKILGHSQEIAGSNDSAQNQIKTAHLPVTETVGGGSDLLLRSLEINRLARAQGRSE